MVSETVGKELVQLERQYWDAIKNNDSKTASSLSADPCVIVGAQGVREVDRQTLASMMESGAFDLNTYNLDDVKVRQVADGVVVVAYKVSEKLVVDGEDVALEAFDSSVWVRQNGGWVCALHTESPAGDPFGRN